MAMHKKNNHAGKGWKHRASAALIGIAVASLLVPIAQAAVSDFSGFASGRQLSDAELGQMRGRFVDKGQIMFFGVEMTSVWQTSAGERLMAGASLDGDLSAAMPKVTFKPNLMVGSAENLTASSMSGNGATVSNDASDNPRGVMQTIQAGGNFNAAANDLQIDILDAAGYAGTVVTSSNPSVPNQVSASGVELSVSNGADGMRVGMNSPMGQVSQAIVPGRGLRQSIQLTSDFQQVRNVTRLQLRMGNRAGGAKTADVLNAVDLARQLRR